MELSYRLVKRLPLRALPPWAGKVHNPYRVIEMVGERGLEPPRRKTLVPKTSASTIPPLAHGWIRDSKVYSLYHKDSPAPMERGPDPHPPLLALGGVYLTLAVESNPQFGPLTSPRYLSLQGRF